MAATSEPPSPATPPPRGQPSRAVPERTVHLHELDKLTPDQVFTRVQDVMARLDQADTARASATSDQGAALEPSAAGPQGPDGQDLLQALALIRKLGQVLAGWEPALIGAARAQGATWSDIAPALGVASRQAAERRYLRLNPQADDAPATTREQRVETTRDRRSSDRAVANWARSNAAELRQLAGQISALPTRDQGGPASRAAIQAALGDDDAAALVAPLSAAAPSLHRGHRALADKIHALEERTARIRTADHGRRNPAPADHTPQPRNRPLLHEDER